jgi:eukaryotic-like serine/threonine-protein kinase
MTSAGPQALPYAEHLGRWCLMERAGSGTFGIVFRARLLADPGTVAALKIAREPMDPRFEREAEVLSRCRSPHLPRLLDKGEWRSPGSQPYPYLVMQWVEGVPLYMWAKRGLTNATATRVLSHIARALAEVHVRGGLHRDVKGDNVLVGPDGFAVLVDFGVATTADAPPLTEPGQLPPGTLHYRAPEALRFKRRGGARRARYEATPADDVYALGVMAYHLVTGTYPPPGTSSWRGERLRKPIPPTELASVCPALERIILRMLSKEPAARLSAEENARSLEALLASGVPQLAGAIRPSAAMLGTERATSPGPRRAQAIPVWLAWAGSSALGALLTLLTGYVLLVGFTPWPPPDAERMEWSLGDAGVRDTPSESADAGVADSSLAAVHGFPTAQPGMRFIGREMPKEPFKGQRRPPCGELEVAINGACWVGPIGKKKPPCGNDGFDHDDGCYIPSFNAPRQPTSGEP